jgi:hypothetical protein
VAFFQHAGMDPDFRAGRVAHAPPVLAFLDHQKGQALALVFPQDGVLLGRAGAPVDHGEFQGFEAGDRLSGESRHAHQFRCLRHGSASEEEHDRDQKGCPLHVHQLPKRYLRQDCTLW